MRYEKCCGAVVYRMQNGQPVFLVEKMDLGHLSLPKGHMEEGETEDVLTEIDSFELTKETGKNKATFSGNNSTSPLRYAIGLIPSSLALAAYAFGNWLPRFFMMLPKLVYTVATKDVF